MPRAANEKATEAERLYRSGMKLVEIATKLGVPAGTVRRWKSTYQWDGEQRANVRKKTSVRNEPPPEVVSVMENPDLTDQQRLFCLYYAQSFNATRSYQKAYGCDYQTANAHGFEQLSKVVIREEITRLKRMRYGKALLESEDVFQKYMDIAFADVTDFVSFGQEEVPVMTAYGPAMTEDPETGETVPMTKKVNVVRSRSSDEVDGSLLTEVSQGKDGFKIKLADRMKALQWLSDHMDLATPEQQAKVENLRASTAKLKGEDPETQSEEDGFLEALKGEAGNVWRE